MAISSPTSSSILDTLFCEEEQDHDHPYDHDHDDDNDNDNDEHYDHSHVILTQTTLQDSSHFHNPPLNNQDFFWEDEELVSLFTKEQEQQLQTHPSTFSFDKTDPSLLLTRKEAVDWILKMKSHFGFTHLTAILCINYVDRFLSSLHFQKDKPWMIQLLAVTCLSLAAKLEETQVPTLLDLQVDTKYLFEPKNIQKMELLVMSSLKWKMNPVTPISFLDHIVRRLQLNTHRLQWDFVNKCENLILSLVSDSRFVGYQPSVLATATILHVIDQVDFISSVDYQTQLLDVLKTTKEKVKECNEMIMEASQSSFIIPKKRKIEEDDTMHNLSVGVMDAHFRSSQFMSSSSSPHCHRYQPTIKKMKIGQQRKFGLVSLSCKAFVNVASSSC